MFTEAGNSTYFRSLPAVYLYTLSKQSRQARPQANTGGAGIRLWSCVAGVQSDTSFPDKPLQRGGNYKEYYVKQVLTPISVCKLFAFKPGYKTASPRIGKKQQNTKSGLRPLPVQ